jgi:hypothetical protein
MVLKLDTAAILFTHLSLSSPTFTVLYAQTYHSLYMVIYFLQIRLLVEGLFSHFFSIHRPSYRQEDRQWFLELVNFQQDWCHPNMSRMVTDSNTDQEQAHVRMNVLEHIPKGTISLCLFKMYLSRLLGECKNEVVSNSMSNPLTFYQHEPRLEVGRMIMKEPALGDPGHYIPLFYQDINPLSTSLCKRMQQPLAHLYFLTVFEHVLSDEQTLASMVRAAGQLSQCCAQEVEPAEQIILRIEFQALLQGIAKVLGKVLETNDIVRLKSNISEVNKLFSDAETGGGEVNGHGMMVSLHLLHSFKSSERFHEQMTTNFDFKYKEMKCLQPVHAQLKCTPAASMIRRLPFMLLVDDVEDLKSLYERVKIAMLGIHVGELQSIAVECNQDRSISGPDAGSCNNHCNLKMMIWLVIFYEFFDKKKNSPSLCKVIGENEFLRLAKLTEQEVRLFQCFLDANLMISRPEISWERSQYGMRVTLHNDEMEDFLHKLFCDTDQSDAHLRYALANMVAVILGCEPRSNHLWYHLFHQQPIWNTYITGFMYDMTMGRGYHYDCGVELTSDGQFGRPVYEKHATRGTYDLHSLYHLLWLNFGSFCMALLTQPDAQENISGQLISGWQPVRHYCVAQLRTIWAHMIMNIKLSQEELSFLFMDSMKKFYKEFNGSGSSQKPTEGIFSTREQLDCYESFLHIHVFKPTRDELKAKFIQHSDLMNHAVFVDMRNIELRYPYYPSEQDVIQSILCSGEDVEEIALLSKFFHQWKRLRIGGDLLPHLVEFYFWLHTELAYVVSKERAYKVKLNTVIEQAVKKYPPDRGKYLQELFTKVKG